MSIGANLVSRLEGYRSRHDDWVFLTFEKVVAPVGVNPVAHWNRPGQGAVKVLPEGVTCERIVVKGSGDDARWREQAKRASLLTFLRQH